MGHSELLDEPQSLKQWAVNDHDLKRSEVNRFPDRITEFLRRLRYEFAGKSFGIGAKPGVRKFFKRALDLG